MKKMTRESVLTLIGKTHEDFKTNGASSNDMEKVFIEYRISAGFLTVLVIYITDTTHQMCITDDDGHWEFPSYESDLSRVEPSHLRAISNAPMPGDTIEVLLDSGADGSALPLSYGNHGVSVETGQPLHFVDAQGGSLGIQDVRLAEICFGDVSIRDHFIIAPVTGPIISLGHLMKLGWIFERFDGDLFLVKGDHSIPVEFRKNSIVAHGTISMLTSVSTEESVNASPQPCQVSTIRLTTLANLADGWNKFNNNLYAIKTYAPQHVNTTLCPSSELMWLRTTLALYPTGYEILEYAQAVSSLEDFELPIPNREQVQEVITLAHNYALPYSYLGFEVSDDHDDEEFLSMNPPPPIEIPAPMEVEASSAAHPPAADEEAEPVPDDRVVPVEDGDEGSVVVDGTTITLDTPLRVIRIACESLGLSKKGSKKVCFSRICTFIKNQQIVASHAAESAVLSEQTRAPNFQKRRLALQHLIKLQRTTLLMNPSQIGANYAWRIDQGRTVMFLLLVQVQLIPSLVLTSGFHRDLKVSVD